MVQDPLPRDCGKYTIIAPRFGDDGIAFSTPRYGYEDESTKLNLFTILNYDNSSGSAGGGTSGSGSSSSSSSGSAQVIAYSGVDETGQSLAHQMLMALPGMTDDIADSILDWLDSDDTPREQGAESDYYSGLSTPLCAPRRHPPARSKNCCW